MHPTEWPDWLRRSVRTALQAFLGVFATALGAIAVGSFPEVEWWVATLRAAGVSALAALASSFVAGLQNNLEDRDAIPSMLKSPASPGPAPIGTPDSSLLERHAPDPPDSAAR